MDIKVIGLCGVAQSGKDTFCEIAIELFKKQNIQAKRVSFADALKKDVESFLLEKIGISSFTTDTKEKTLIRDFLVSYGTKLMRKIDENIWINKVDQIVRQNIKNNIVTIITDIRYENELIWARDNFNGVILHLSRYFPDSTELVCPANEEEERNDPILRELADRSLSWNSAKDTNILKYIVADELDQLLQNNQ
jgi:hypothetical protein